MILLRPLVIFITFILSYIPILQFIGLALLFFIYHVLIRNRNFHIKKMKEVYSSNNLDFPNIKEKSPLIWLFVYIASFLIINIFYLYLSQQISTLSFEELESFILPNWQIYLFLGSFIISWISYATIINRIDKDQWQLQESEITHKIVKNRFIKLRDGNVAMFLRIITLDIYQWFLLFFLLRETTIHYFEDGTATGRYTQLIKTQKVEKTDQNSQEKFENKEEENLQQKLIEKIKNTEENERYSIIFSELTSLEDKQKAKEVLDELYEKNYIKREQYEKLLEFL